MNSNKLAWAIGLGVAFATVLNAQAGERHKIQRPIASIFYDREVLSIHGLLPRDGFNQDDGLRLLKFDIPLSQGSNIEAIIEGDQVSDVFADRVALSEGLHFVSTQTSREVLVFDLVVIEDESATDAHFDSKRVALEITGVRVGFNRRTGNLTLPGENLRISVGLAEALGNSALAGVSIGRAVIHGSIETIASSNPIADTRSTDTGGVTSAPQGPDVTFCELYDLRQFGRLGSVVGMGIATTSWNVGSADAIWHALPLEEHPFIGQNLYRLKNDRFEQIGQSWVKHAFYALDDEQCGTQCTYEQLPEHGEGDWLGVGCTDTYTSGLNAGQSNLGPRHEINPWTGAYNYATSHMNPAPPAEPSHTPISHRLQVHDDDLLATLNPGASYFAEGYYVVNVDVGHMNSAAWKPVSFSGAALGTWNASMTGSGVRPTSGFALDAWPGARRTTIAQELPVIEFESPDGRCVLGAKSTSLGDGLWHYEFALLNVDMHRKVNSFTVPLRVGTAISNIDFHAVRSHDEPFSNDPWSVTGGSASDDFITWSTTNNPVRWGTVYNFRFDATAAPADTTVTLGLYEPGSPSSVSGITTGPSLLDPACPAESPLAVAGGEPRNRYLSVQPVNNGLQTAMRVRLASLHHPLSGTAGGGGFGQFEGHVRWVGPPSTYQEGPGVGATFKGASLQCEPYFHNWGTVGTLHIFGPEILPSSVYEVQMIHQSCEGEIGNESRYSSIVQIPTSEWGDVVAAFAGQPGAGTQPNFLDVSSVAAKFSGFNGAPIKARAQLQPNSPNPTTSVNFLDIAAAVAAFSGGSYTYSGPTGCP